MSKEHYRALQKREDYKKDNQLYLKNRVLLTFKSLIKTFFNREIENGQFLLDLGTADGALVQIAKNEGLQSLGLDINQVNFETDKIKLGDESCDIISAISLIEHIQNPGNLLNETRRLLKRNGFFILVTPDWSYSMKNFFDDPTHVRPYTKKSLEFLLHSHGFKNIKIVPWLVCKPVWMWKIPFSFLIARLIPFRGSKNPWIPSFLKGKSKILLAISTK